MKKPRKENKFKKKKTNSEGTLETLSVSNDAYFVVRGSLEDTTLMMDMLKEQGYKIDNEFSVENMKEHIPIGIYIKNIKGQEIFGINGTFLYLYRHNYDKYGISPLLSCRDIIDHFDELIIKRDSKFFNDLIKGRRKNDGNKD